MNILIKDKPRIFKVGINDNIFLKDYGAIELENDEQISILTCKGSGYEIVRKSWGFYAGPSLNVRLNNAGFRAVIVKTIYKKFFIFFVENTHEGDFYSYIKSQNYSIVSWLDSDLSICNFKNSLNKNTHIR